MFHGSLLEDVYREWVFDLDRLRIALDTTQGTKILLPNCAFGPTRLHPTMKYGRPVFEVVPEALDTT